MKLKIIKLSFLFLMMSILTSSKENAAINKTHESIKCAQSCLQKNNEYAININCKQAPVIDVKKENMQVSSGDNEVYLSPISRFILLQ